jgi:aryl carrier-like protein
VRERIAEIARRWRSRGYQVDLAPDSLELGGGRPQLLAWRDGIEIAVVVRLRGRWCDTPLLDLAEHVALLDWQRGAPGREIHWVTVPPAARRARSGGVGRHPDARSHFSAAVLLSRLIAAITGSLFRQRHCTLHSRR